jgi:predicted RNase H-like nuclease
MHVVLGIDAAWTLTQPSGVALVAGESGRWRLVAVSPSYQHFHSLAIDSALAASGGRPNASALLASSRTLCGGTPVDVVAIDMPLALQAITGRRASDNAVSRAFGAFQCGTHSPSITRPGRVSDELRQEFIGEGYELQTRSVTSPALIEVYPHPALVRLANASVRLPYKISRARRYWPALTPTERKQKLIVEWARIVRLLDGQIGGVAHRLQQPSLDAPSVQLKAYEDMLDAVVCAWVGICVLETRATAYGDDNSAIWIPLELSTVEPRGASTVVLKP